MKGIHTSSALRETATGREKRYHRMKWFEKLREISRKPERKETPKEEARKVALRIEELEARLAPTAIWGD
jgi:hypothetical protein